MAKRSSKPADVIDVGDVGGATEDEQLVTTDGRLVIDWLGSIRAFFFTALAFEREGEQMLEEARTWEKNPPVTAAQDEALQRFVMRTTERRKSHEDHWAPISSALFRFHRRVTGRRGIGSKYFEDSNAIGNKLHARYVDDARRRAAEKERLDREQAEFLAKQEREQELARLEADAVAAEEKAGELSARETAFVDGFCGVHHRNGQAAAKAAGYRDPVVQAARLLSSPKIQIAIKAKLQATEIRRQAAAKAEAPIVVEHQEVKPDISRAAGASDRETWSGELLDERRLMTAFLGCTPEDFQNKFGIPADLWCVDPKKLNEYARALHENLDRWPGVRHKRKTSVV